MKHYSSRLAVQQRVLPKYRAPFFDLLAESCDGGMSLFAGLPRANEGVILADDLNIAKYVHGQNIHLFSNELYLCYQRGLMDWLEDWNPDALIVEANPRYLSTPAAMKWMHERGRPVVGWGLGAPPVNRFREEQRLKLLRQLDGVICYSQRGANEYADLGFPVDRIFVAHNSVSPAPTWFLPKRPDTFDEKPTILFVGRLQLRKNVDYLLGACAEIESEPRLVIVGDGPERAALESLAEEVYPNAEFVGAKHGAEIKPYFEEADLFVLPGTGGLAVHEAMSYGLPIIVAQGDGTQDDLVREENGWQIPPAMRDLDALVSTMKEALSDVPRLRKMGEASYRIVKEEINIGKMVEMFVMALNSLEKK